MRLVAKPYLNGLTPEEQYLVHLLACPAKMPEMRVDPNALLRCAFRHRVASLIASSDILKDCPFFKETAPFNLALQQIVYTTTARNLKILYELKPLLFAFESSQIPVMVLKGVHLLITLYKNLAQRPMSDIDLLVPKNRLQDAQKLMYALGYHQKEEIHPTDWHQRKSNDIALHLPVFERQNAIPVEVHGEIRSYRSVLLPEDEIWATKQRFEILPGIGAYGLSNEMLLLYLLFHLEWHAVLGTARLIWYYDLAMLIQKNPELSHDSVTKIHLDPPIRVYLSAVDHLFLNRSDQKNGSEHLKPLALLADRNYGLLGNEKENYLQHIWASARRYPSVVDRCRFVWGHLFPNFTYLKMRYPQVTSPILLLWWPIRPLFLGWKAGERLIGLVVNKVSMRLKNDVHI